MNLLQFGFSAGDCPHCNGAGRLPRRQPPGEPLEPLKKEDGMPSLEPLPSEDICPSCGGSGRARPQSVDPSPRADQIIATPMNLFGESSTFVAQAHQTQPEARTYHCPSAGGSSGGFPWA